MFDEAKIYKPNDPALACIATVSTLAHWRHENRGPVFVRLGARIGYLGRDLNRWLESRAVKTNAR